MENESGSVFAKWFNFGEALQLFDHEAFVYLAVCLVLLVIGKWAYNRLIPHNLSDQLTRADNKAVALAFSGYICGLGIIIWSILESPVGHEDIFIDIGSTFIWCGIGMLLLHAARLINDKFIFNQFDINKELVKDKNEGTGVVICASYISAALVVRSTLYAETESSFSMSLLETIVYFILTQSAFVAFSKLYQTVSAYDLHDEIEQDNIAAGVGFGMTLIAIALVLSNYLLNFDSLIGLVVWFMISTFLIIVCRYMVDKFILPGRLLDEEISRDRNWGAALVEGSAAISLALIITSVFG